MMKISVLLGAAALSLGLAGTMSAQKKVEYLGPPVNEKGVPKGGKVKKDPPAEPKEAKPQPAQPTGPQSGQAVGFGVGRPGAATPGPTNPPLVNPPDTIKPPEGQPDSKVTPVKNPSQTAETDRPVGTSVKNPSQTAEIDRPGGKPVKKKVAPGKKVRARRVKKG